MCWYFLLRTFNYHLLMSFLLTNLKEALSPRRPGFGGKVWRTVWAHGLRHFMCYTIVLSAFQNGLTKRISTAPNLRGRRCSCGVALWESRHISSLTMSDHLGIMHLDALRILGIQPVFPPCTPLKRAPSWKGTFHIFQPSIFRGCVCCEGVKFCIERCFNNMMN